MEFKDRLKKYRSEKGYTQDALARKIFVSRSAIAKWESGLGIPSEESIKALCLILDIKKESLFPNNDSEPLLVQKNVKMKQRTTIAIALATVLAISLAVFTFLAIHSYLNAKEISSLTPTITKIYFDNKREDANSGVDEYNGEYILYKNRHAQVYIEVTSDPRLDISSTQVAFENGKQFTCSFVGEQSDGKTTKRIYKTTVVFSDSNVRQLKLSTATYNFYDRADGNKYKQKNFIIKAQPIPIIVSDTTFATVTLKFNKDTVITFDIEKGESAHTAILSLGKQEFLLEHLLNTRYSQLLNYLTFDGWERSDGLDIYEPIYSDITLNARVSLKPSATFTISAKDLQCYVFKTVTPNFTLNGQPYTNVFYTLRTDSDCIEITEKREIKATKPGVAHVSAQCDLGFLSGNCAFTVTVSDKVNIEVFGYKKIIPPGGAYYTSVQGIYNFDTGKAELTQQSKQSITEYYNKQNDDFYAATGQKRILADLKFVDNLCVIPLFETDYAFDYSALNLNFQIGSYSISANNILPITESVENISMRSFGYSEEKINGLDEINATQYYIYNGDIIYPDEIFSELKETTTCIAVCCKINGVCYYNEYQIPVILTE